MSAKRSILSRFEDLPPRLQQAARYLIDNPNDIVTHSMRGLAQKSGILPATLSRLAVQLGYSGWHDLKKAFVSDLGLAGKHYGERAKNLAKRQSGSSDLVSEVFSTCQSNLQQTQGYLAERLEPVARQLQAAPTVHVVGFRASFAIAYSFFYGYRLFRNSVELIDSHCAGLELHLRKIQKDDAVLVVSFAPYSKECLEVIEAARKAQARVLVLTDSEASPLALKADDCLLFAVESASFFPSISAGIVVVEALLGTLVALSKQDVVKPLNQAEQHLVKSGAYI